MDTKQNIERTETLINDLPPSRLAQADTDQ